MFAVVIEPTCKSCFLSCSKPLPDAFQVLVFQANPPQTAFVMQQKKKTSILTFTDWHLIFQVDMAMSDVLYCISDSPNIK